MKWMDFFVRLGADPPPYGVYGKGMQRRMAEKDAIHVCGLVERTTRQSAKQFRGGEPYPRHLQ